MHREKIKFVLLPNRKTQQKQQLWNSGYREEYKADMFPNTEGSLRESWRPMGPKNDIPWSGMHSPSLAAGMHRKTRKRKALRVATKPSTMPQPSSHNRASNQKNNNDFRVPFDHLTFHKTSETRDLANSSAKFHHFISYIDGDKPCRNKWGLGEIVKDVSCNKQTSVRR